jgi:hypothetical protein
MEDVAINWWAVIVAAVVKFVIGAAWYAPQLLGKQWQAEIGMTQEQVRAGLAPALIAEIVTDLVMAAVLACFISYAGATTLVNGALIGLAAWVGFVATISIAQVFYERKSWRLWAINNGYAIISLIIMGAILGAWR